MSVLFPRLFVQGHVQIVYRQVQAAKIRTSLHICPVWSAPLLLANRIIGYYRMYEWKAKAWMILCACTGWSESAHFVLVLRHFLLDIPFLTLLLLNTTCPVVANSVDPDQLASSENSVDPDQLASLIWICIVCHYICEFLSKTWIK